MLKLFRVKENSLAPLYQPGDFAIVSRLPLLRTGYPQPGSVIVFRQKYFGVLIKQVERVVPEKDEIYVLGANESSVDSRSFGPIHKQDLIGKAIWRVARPAAPAAQSGSQPATVSPYLILLIGVMAVSTASIFIRLAQEALVPSLVIAAFRLLLASLVLTIPALLRYRDELRRLRRLDLVLAVLSGIFLAFHFALWISSLEATSVASSVVLVSTTPLWVALLAPFALRERVTRIVLLGLALALLGSAIVSSSETCTWTASGLACPSLSTFIHARAFLADLLALGGAVMASLYLLIGRGLRSRMSLVPYVFVVYGIAAGVLVVLMTVAHESFTGYAPTAYVWLVLLALIPQLLGHSTLNWALRYIPAAFVSISLLGEPVGSSILAFFVLNEKPTFLKVFGAILILAGILIASRPPKSTT